MGCVPFNDQRSCTSWSLFIRGRDSELDRSRGVGGLDDRAAGPLSRGGAAAGAADLATGTAGCATGSADPASRLTRGA